MLIIKLENLKLVGVIIAQPALYELAAELNYQLFAASIFLVTRQLFGAELLVKVRY